MSPDQMKNWFRKSLWDWKGHNRTLLIADLPWCQGIQQPTRCDPNSSLFMGKVWWAERTTNQVHIEWTRGTLEPFKSKPSLTDRMPFLLLSTFNLMPPPMHTHILTHTLPWGRLPSLPLSGMLSGNQGMNERPGNLTVSNDGCAEVEPQVRPIMLPQVHSLRDAHGEREDRGMAPPRPPVPPPPHQGLHQRDIMSLSPSRLHCCQWLALTFCFPSLYPSLLSSAPHALFSPSLSLSFSFLFCFHEQQRDARVKAGDILPLFGHLKRQLPLPPISPLE